MKRYSISVPYHEEFQYINSVDSPDESIEQYRNSRMQKGLQIYDNIKKEVIFHDVRPTKGVLVLTFTSGERTWESKQEFVNLDYMQEREDFYKGSDAVLKIEKYTF